MSNPILTDEEVQIALARARYERSRQAHNLTGWLVKRINHTLRRFSAA